MTTERLHFPNYIITSKEDEAKCLRTSPFHLLHIFFAKFCQKKILRAQWLNLYQSRGFPQGKFDFEEIVFLGRNHLLIDFAKKKLISQI